MTKHEFLLQFQEMLQCEKALTYDTCLLDLEEWDSLAFMLLIAFFDKNFGLRLTFAQLKNCDTTADIIALSCGKIA